LPGDPHSIGDEPESNSEHLESLLEEGRPSDSKDSGISGVRRCLTPMKRLRLRQQ
jgi:hypothetical protein